MKVQRACLPERDRITWLVIGDDYLPVRPVQEFLAYLENIERSPNTIRSYAHHLKLYWQYLQEMELEWTNIGLSELAEFIAWLREPHPALVSMQEHLARRSESTVNIILAAVAVFYDYHERVGTVKGVPLYRTQMQTRRRYKSFLHHITKSKPVKTRLLKLKEVRRMPKTLTSEQVKQLIDACSCLRDRFLVSLLYETGMRVGQALGLRHADIHSWDNLIEIVPRNENVNGARAKTQQSYVLHVPEHLMALYTDYLVYEFEDIESDYVFVNLWDGAIGQPMKYATVADLFSRLSKKTGLAVHPHLLRHTHATELVRAGWDSALVRKRLGHAHIQTTTQKYIHLNDDDMKRAYQIYRETRKP